MSPEPFGLLPVARLLKLTIDSIKPSSGDSLAPDDGVFLA